MKIIMIRHGMTAGNLKRKYIGCKTDEELCVQGREAVSCKSDYYKSVINDIPSLYFSSPMSRCMQTMEILFENAEYDIVEEFMEMDFGIFENKNHQELNGNEIYQKWIDSNGTMKIPEGEAFEDFKTRCIKGFYKAVNKLMADNISQAVIVTHGGCIMAIMSYLTGGKYYDYMVQNAEGYEALFDIEDGKILNLSLSRI